MADQPQKMTHAQRRRKEAQDATRLKLRGGEYLRRLHEIAKSAPDLEPTRVPAVQLAANIYLRLLAKCIPDLKAVEGNINLTGQVTVSFTDRTRKL